MPHAPELPAANRGAGVATRARSLILVGSGPRRAASGRDGMVDLIAAHKWFNLAALRGRVDAVAMRREVAEQMSDAEIATAQREARAWMTAH
ncbi:MULTISPECIES: hypothetical protein [unclassified Bradyrhizobium]|uniref:hypothetical protein n=2 Tax=unclassified Bradyrhizobium TaxID=2631580 RepID=UPI002916DACE|nr:MULTISPECIES: hypothetical protein [unclassified Bradyrhizobium]